MTAANITDELLMKEYGLAESLIQLGNDVENDLADVFKNFERIKEYNFYKILLGMKKIGLSDQHFQWPTGYGYNDLGREKIDQLYSEVFGSEDALVRSSFANGTHVLGLCLKAVLAPGDQMISVTGKPYDTLHELIGLSGNYQKSLINQGVQYEEVSILETGEIDLDKSEELLKKAKSPKLIYIQRSTGYSFRKALTIDEIERIVKRIKNINSSVLIMVDNCYGEFLETREPTEVGADLIAGSLIKNPGGGIVLSGGYIAGKKELVNKVANEYTVPGIERECGLTFGQSRSLFQGLFYAPGIVMEALKSAAFCGLLFQRSGYPVQPEPDDPRSDIIQAVSLGSEVNVRAFCEAVQEVAPVDSFVKPEPWDMPGYQDKVIMAAGTFIQGSSIELSADGPIRPPYIVYFQGGLSYYHGKVGALNALNKIQSLSKTL